MRPGISEETRLEIVRQLQKAHPDVDPEVCSLAVLRAQNQRIVPRFRSGGTSNIKPSI
jgi:hypothetical protein